MEIVIIRDQIRASKEEINWFNTNFHNTLQLFQRLRNCPKDFTNDNIVLEIDKAVCKDAELNGLFPLNNDDCIKFYKCCSNIIYIDYLDQIEVANCLGLNCIETSSINKYDVKYRNITEVEEMALGFLQDCFLWNYQYEGNDKLIYITFRYLV